MLSTYVPILGLFALAAAFAVFSVAAAPFIGPRRYNRAKLQAYECGIEPVDQPLTGGRFPVKYYLTAMLFIIFDIEIIFLYPWAVIFDRLDLFGLVEMVVFAVAVVVSFGYLLANGALDWGPPKSGRTVAPAGQEPRTSRSTVRKVSRGERAA